MCWIPDPLRCQEFDYTCDDCMLPWNHYDPPELNDGSLWQIAAGKDNNHQKNAIFQDEKAARSRGNKRLPTASSGKRLLLPLQPF